MSKHVVDIQGTQTTSQVVHTCCMLDKEGHMHVRETHAHSLEYTHAHNSAYFSSQKFSVLCLHEDHMMAHWRAKICSCKNK
jgi:hypothetical protein